jgi:hypothetical protein
MQSTNHGTTRHIAYRSIRASARSVCEWYELRCHDSQHSSTTGTTSEVQTSRNNKTGLKSFQRASTKSLCTTLSITRSAKPIQRKKLETYVLQYPCSLTRATPGQYVRPGHCNRVYYSLGTNVASTDESCMPTLSDVPGPTSVGSRMRSLDVHDPAKRNDGPEKLVLIYLWNCTLAK